ncbi:MAG TPA: hypothetical protein VHT70_03075 [Candidatus Saccharimonadales bacterium]|nr:hypothetical protein [Candidatus Saccharimonadales bacterium]
MAATYRSSNTANTGAAAAGSLAVSLPAGVQVGDVLVAGLSVDGGAAVTITPPAGWTSIRTTSGTSIQNAVYWRLVDGTEPSSYTWTFDTTRAASAVMGAYSGAYPFPPPSTAATTANTASTSITMAAGVSTYSGTAVEFIATRNTTGTATTSVSGSWTGRADTTTTASAFMETDMSDQAKALPTGGLPTNTATCTRSVTSVCISVFLDDAHPPLGTLGEDEYFVTGITSATTTSNFSNVQTNYANELLLAIVSINKDVGATVSSITTTGQTWELVGRANTNAGSTELWRTVVATPTRAIGVSVTFSASIVSANITVMGIAGANPSSNGLGAIGAFTTGSTSGVPPSLSLTTTQNNSWVFFGANLPGSTGTPTAGSGQTIMRFQNDTTNSAIGLMQRNNALTTSSGTNVTMNDTSPTTPTTNMLAVEIVPSATTTVSNLMLLGVG